MPEKLDPIKSSAIEVGGIVGDQIEIEAGCDLDSIVVSWSYITMYHGELQLQNLRDIRGTPLNFKTYLV